MLSFLLALSWQAATLNDPLGRPVYVAEVAPDSVRSLRFLCGGMTGVVLQFNLGRTTASPDAFSVDDPQPENVRFAFAEGNYETTAVRAPITDGIGTYEIKGEEAIFVLSLMRDSEQVEVQHGDATAAFPLSGARAAIDETRAQCPYKYPDL
ncbi:MAG: hypothetical protein HOP13_05630 [Alphaproteobacteria bacterium]|nr:hypothetical protein [Alphaproteobacteria bacterium]